MYYDAIVAHFFAMLPDDIDVENFDLLEFDDVEEEPCDIDYERFEFVPEEGRNNLVEVSVADGTASKLRFVEKLFNSWKKERNRQRGELVPDKNIEDFSVEELNT